MQLRPLHTGPEKKHCKCNPVTIPARTRIARVEEIQAIQKVSPRVTDRSEGEDALPPHLISVLDTATELMEDQRARAAALLAKHVNTFPAPGSPITGRTDAVVHERSTPTVLVTKKDGSTHFCVDYRRLNARTKKDAFPLPQIDDSLKSLSGQAWFSTLDLANGYWQVRLSENAKPKTAFATHSGLFQFAVMPFGLCNSPATFERLMSQVMRGLHWKRCLVYINDILVFGNDFESALHRLELVLDRVAEYGLQLKSTKCNLSRTSVPFLGHIVGRAGLECDLNKLSAVANWIPPTMTKGVRKFLGFTGYYR